MWIIIIIIIIIITIIIIIDRLCGLVVRVTGYRTEMHCISCEVRTEFICYAEAGTNFADKRRSLGRYISLAD
jgi:hypothetical protein